MSIPGRPKLRIHGEAWEPAPLRPDEEAELLRMARIIGYKSAWYRLATGTRPVLAAYNGPGRAS